MAQYLGLPPLASDSGAPIDSLMLYVHWLMLVLFVGWFTYFVYVLLRFRQSKNPKANYVGVRSHASTYLEGAVAAVEGVLLLAFSIPIWAMVVDRFPPEGQSTVFRVMAQQFNWNFLHPGMDGEFGRQDIKHFSPLNKFGRVILADQANLAEDPRGVDDFTTLDEIVVPVDRPVVVHVGSLDVIHSFNLKEMRTTMDAIPGLNLPLWFTPNRTGEYEIVCAQLCGPSHYLMRGVLRVVSDQEYQEWMRERSMQARAAVLPPPEYE
jgi:cytochrome c oxidase subunit II